jgi:pyridoxine 5-phosphate synthase
MKLGVNIDHIALLREGRKIHDPNPLFALNICAEAGADQITIHLREDRRHINDKDAEDIISQSPLPVNLECSINMIDIACKLKPNRVTIVPENREEVTTEGGLDLRGNFDKIYSVARQLRVHDIEVSLFIDPTSDNIYASRSLESQIVELHTGKYANIDLMLNSNLRYMHNSIKELEVPNHKLTTLLRDAQKELEECALFASDSGLMVVAGHGLNYQNVQNILKIQEIEELNIGQSIIARSIFVGLKQAIGDMKSIIK